MYREDHIPTMCTMYQDASLAWFGIKKCDEIGGLEYHVELGDFVAFLDQWD